MLEAEKQHLVASSSQMRQQLSQLQAAHAKAEARNMIYLARHKNSGGKVYGAQQMCLPSAAATAAPAHEPSSRRACSVPVDAAHANIPGSRSSGWLSDSSNRSS
mmetsp:Transcript_19682/g.42463  ORF Transcript_19682/g.42463 Transcript_19682/m.42463 type:complete len:104 (-) Transcript_19682:555-866(-)